MNLPKLTPDQVREAKAEAARIVGLSRPAEPKPRARGAASFVETPKVHKNVEVK